MGSRVLYLFASAAPPVHYLLDAVRQAQESDWQVCVGLTPTAHEWLGDKTADLEDLTGYPVRYAPRTYGEETIWPPGDVTVVAPATLNTVNSCALGLTTNVVTGHVAEALSKRWPLILMPCVNTALATHPQFQKSVATLDDAGVHVLLGTGGFVPNEPGQGKPETYPWHLAIAAAERVHPNVS